LVLFIDISVNWPYHNHWFLVIINIVTILILHTCLWQCCSTPLNATGIPVLPRTIKISSPLYVTLTNCPSAGFVGDQICWRH
jgi:hypothetical protein